MAGRFEGKVAFITGVARGQGRAHAVRLASEGANIIGIDLCDQIKTVAYPMSTLADLDETTKLVEGLGSRMIARPADVRDRESLQTVLDEGVEAFGRLDFVIANAGIMPMFGPEANSMQCWQDCLDVLLTGVLHTVEATYPRLVEQGEGGSIIVTSSMAAMQPQMRTSDAHTLGVLGYSAAKAALLNLMQNYASLLAYHRVRVNALVPTGVNTPMIQNEMVETRFATANPEDIATLINAIPVNAVEPEDIANAAAWLCSDESRFYTGSAMRIDAGASLR